MLRKLRLICAVALALSAFFPSFASAQAEEGSKVYHAFAYFYHIDSNGCDVFETWLDVYDRSIRPGSGPAERSTTLVIQHLAYDTCTETYRVIQDAVTLPPGAFQMQGLKGASLEAAVSFTNRRGEEVPMIVDLSWACAAANAYRYRGNEGVCAPLELSGSVLLESRELMDSESMQGELSFRRSPWRGPLP